MHTLDAPRPPPTMNGSVKSVTATQTPHALANVKGASHKEVDAAPIMAQEQSDATRACTSIKQTALPNMRVGSALSYTTLFNGSKCTKRDSPAPAKIPAASLPASAPAIPFTDDIVAALWASIAVLGPQIAAALRVPSTAGDTRLALEGRRASNACKKAALADGFQRGQCALEQRGPKKALLARLAHEASCASPRRLLLDEIRTLDRLSAAKDEEAMDLRDKLLSDQ